MAQKLARQIADLSLCDVAELISSGEISAVETLEAAFERIDQLEPVHHAFIWQDREAATARAAWLDKARAAGEIVGPLHGVPMAHKDMYYRAGRLSTCGSLIRRKERETFRLRASESQWLARVLEQARTDAHVFG